MLFIIQHAAQEAASSDFADVLWDGFDCSKICIGLLLKSMSALQHLIMSEVICVVTYMYLFLIHLLKVNVQHAGNLTLRRIFYHSVLCYQ